MPTGSSDTFQRARYYSSVTLIYMLTLLLAFYAFYPRLLGLRDKPAAAAQAAGLSPPKRLAAVPPIVISGTPVKLSIPSLGVNLAVQPGYYDPADNSWTLSDTKAQYAVLTPPANNYSGGTFIYGHRLPNIFAGLHLVEPGAEALVYTSNHHVFKYRFDRSWLVPPQDTSELSYQGASALIVQTCGGSWDSERQMFIFNFSGVAK